MEFLKDLTPEEYNALRESVDWRPASIAQAKRGLEHTTFLLVAREGGKAVAMGRVLFDFGYTAYIGDVIVRPEYQGRGIGKYIVESLIQAVMDATDDEDRIMFILGAAKGKEGFYEKLGFQVRPNELVGPGMTMWLKK